MKRKLIAAVIGGVVLFVWGMVSFMALPWHQMQTLPGERDIVAAFQGAGVESGIYHIPGYLVEKGLTDEQKKEFRETADENHKAGIAEIQSVSPTLVAVADYRDGLAGQPGQIGVFLMVYPRGQSTAPTKGT